MEEKKYRIGGTSSRLRNETIFWLSFGVGGAEKFDEIKFDEFTMTAALELIADLRQKLLVDVYPGPRGDTEFSKLHPRLDSIDLYEVRPTKVDVSRQLGIYKSMKKIVSSLSEEEMDILKELI